MRDFKKLAIWKKAIELSKEVYLITRELPDDEKFGLLSQMRRASVSIPSNIAEGTSRNSEIEYKRFLEFAIGSAFELETQLVIAHTIGYLNQEEVDKLQNEIVALEKQINALIFVLKRNSSNSKS
jgi:four helix bundle protein